jgi:hypothetical protein
MKVPWTRLIRFSTADGRVLRGEPILPSEDFDLGKVTEADQLKAKVIVGDDPFDTTGKTIVSDEVATVKKLLGPLAKEEVPILRCVGLNYAKHSKSRSPGHGLNPFLRRMQPSWDILLIGVKSRKPDGNHHRSLSSSSSPTRRLPTTMLR